MTKGERNQVRHLSEVINELAMDGISGCVASLNASEEMDALWKVQGEIQLHAFQLKELTEE